MALPRALVVLGLAAAALPGCGTSDDRAQARTTVERFFDAVRHHDGGAACQELSDDLRTELESQEKKPCDQAVTGLDFQGGHVVRTRVYVTNAQVDLAGGETEYLDRGPSGWEISAVICKPEDGKPASRPFQCEVQA